MPQGFFTQWPNQTGANWLVLLDALDEVPAEQRPRLMDWFKRILKTVGPNRIVITSRPSGYSPGELDDKLFGHYDLLSFTPEQTGEFALRWFDHDQIKADRFLQELDRIRAGDLRGTPLLLTIAAKVYLEKGTLPERRSALYDQFVGIWLAEAEQHGLRAELGEVVCDVARFALARLALAMTEQPMQSEASLSQIAAAYLRDAVPLSADRAQVVGERFVRVMARRSGVFTCRGDEYDFIHPTFREYLAACTIVRECKHELEQVWQRVVSRWEYRNWHEVALFAMGILSDAGQDVTVLVRRAWGKGEEGLRFAGNALAEQVKVETSLSDGIIDALLARAREMRGIYTLFAPKPTTILGELRGYPRAGEGLLALARDEKVDTEVRVGAAEALAKLGRADDLLALARNKKVDWRAHARAAEALGRLGQAEEAASILLALARDEKAKRGVRAHAAEALGRLGRASDLLALARDEKVWEGVRAYAAQALGRLGQVEEAAPILLALARDEKVWKGVRVLAAEALGRLGRASDLLALAHDEKVDTDVRECAAEALGRLGRAEEAASTLLTLARDEKVWGRLRCRAAEALGELRWVEEAASILLALARDEKVWEGVREDAAQALGRFADARVLASIERIAQEDKDKNVRRAAREAIEQIRRRA